MYPGQDESWSSICTTLQAVTQTDGGPGKPLYIIQHDQEGSCPVC